MPTVVSTVSQTHTELRGTERFLFTRLHTREAQAILGPAKAFLIQALGKPQFR